jgi:hypothetical protein
MVWYCSNFSGVGAGISGSGFCGALKNQIQVNTATEYATIKVRPHKNLNLVPKSENFVVINKATSE